MDDILSEQDALKLDQEEVQQLGKVLKHSLMSFLGDSVVSTGTEGARDALLQNDKASNLNGGSHWITN